MPKSSSPLRLDAHLMDSARQSATLENRSVAEQIEHWARLGRVASKFIPSNALPEIIAGSLIIKTEAPDIAPIDIDDIFDSLDSERDSGELTASLPQASVRYQSSKIHPGLLEQVDTSGQITLGHFRGGKFLAMTEDGKQG